MMKYLRAFIAGIVLPTLLLPIPLYTMLALGKTQVLAPFIHVIPLLWGIWNILYFALFIKIFPWDLNVRLLLTGAILGLLVALYGVFCLNLPAILGFPSQIYYLPLVVGPIVYAILWRFVVKPLNHIVGLRDE
jgi:hypothetical protein